jgi:hypothetical protein
VSARLKVLDHVPVGMSPFRGHGGAGDPLRRSAHEVTGLGGRRRSATQLGRSARRAPTREAHAAVARTVGVENTTRGADSADFGEIDTIGSPTAILATIALDVAQRRNGRATRPTRALAEVAHTDRAILRQPYAAAAHAVIAHRTIGRALDVRVEIDAGRVSATSVVGAVLAWLYAAARVVRWVVRRVVRGVVGRIIRRVACCFVTRRRIIAGRALNIASTAACRYTDVTGTTIQSSVTHCCSWCAALAALEAGGAGFVLRRLTADVSPQAEHHRETQGIVERA